MADIDVLGSVLKVAATFALLFVTLRVVGRLNGSRPRIGGRTDQAARPVELVGRSSLGRSASVAVVRFGERCFALGVTDQRINLIAEVEIDLSAPEPAGTPALENRPSWRDLIENLRERTVRR
jgi:flagellar biogenesis protein FliO